MTISNRLAILKNLAQGFGVAMPQISIEIAGTAAAAASGYFTSAFRVNTLGSTLPTTIVEMISNDAATNQLLSVFNGMSNAGSGKNTYFGRYYRIGGVTLGTTGNNFTHDPATFPIMRNVSGQTTNLNLIPVIYVTTALTGTAATFTISTSGSTPGYTNQIGSSVAGNVTFTFPSATTIIGSAYIPMLNYGDSGIQDISSVDVTTAATTGAFDIYGFEPMMFGSALAAASAPAIHNSAIGAVFMTDVRPATPTAGTLTHYKGYLNLGTGSAASYAGMDIEVSNQ